MPKKCVATVARSITPWHYIFTYNYANFIAPHLTLCTKKTLFVLNDRNNNNQNLPLNKMLHTQPFIYIYIYRYNQRGTRNNKNNDFMQKGINECTYAVFSGIPVFNVYKKGESYSFSRSGNELQSLCLCALFHPLPSRPRNKLIDKGGVYNNIPKHCNSFTNETEHFRLFFFFLPFFSSNRHSSDFLPCHWLQDWPSFEKFSFLNLFVIFSIFFLENDSLFIFYLLNFICRPIGRR